VGLDSKIVWQKLEYFFGDELEWAWILKLFGVGVCQTKSPIWHNPS
jgi:hypothetical protein